MLNPIPTQHSSHRVYVLQRYLHILHFSVSINHNFDSGSALKIVTGEGVGAEFSQFAPFYCMVVEVGWAHVSAERWAGDGTGETVCMHSQTIMGSGFVGLA
jgi:hypothetical protein